MARDMSGIVTAKAKAVTPDPQPLISFLEAYANWEQYVIDSIWDLEYVPGKGRLHVMFYKTLRKRVSGPITATRSSSQQQKL